MARFTSRSPWVGPLKIHLSLLISLLLIGIAVPLIWISYARGRDAAVSAAEERMQLLTRRTVDRFRIVVDSVEPVIVLAAASDTFAAPPPAAIDRKRWSFIAALRNLPHIDGLFAGYPDGSFLHAVNLKDEAWRGSIGAPRDAAFAVRAITLDSAGQPQSSWAFFAAAESELGHSGPVAANYDPRNRPWYLIAASLDETVAIGPYVTATTRTLALTVARAHRDMPQVVIGADIPLATIAHFLATEKVSARGTAYVLDKFGKVIIHSDPAIMERLLAAPADATGDAFSLLTDPVFDAARAALHDAPERDTHRLQITVDGQAYIGSAVRMDLSQSLEGGTLVMVAPLADITGESEKQLREGLLFSGLLLAGGIVATLFIANLITRSLSTLTGQAARLSDLDLGETGMAPSYISEINALARALALAREAIRSFALYVPRELVRKIVATSGVASGAATREEITIIFTDIRDFTTICEKTSPEEVVGMLSAYFEAINRCVEANNGSIIQFLGDSVCAMWNAPIADPDHAAHACAGALAIAETVAAFNADQAARGKPALVTRIGVHSGQAVVGNVGAASRLQYTAMGDTVNVASRLEGINKEFGTTIMVSREVRERCGERFHFRPLGASTAKGRSEAVEIFELVEANAPEVRGKALSGASLGLR